MFPCEILWNFFLGLVMRLTLKVMDQGLFKSLFRKRKIDVKKLCLSSIITRHLIYCIVFPWSILVFNCVSICISSIKSVEKSNLYNWIFFILIMFLIFSLASKSIFLISIFLFHKGKIVNGNNITPIYQLGSIKNTGKVNFFRFICCIDDGIMTTRKKLVFLCNLIK